MKRIAVLFIAVLMLVNLSACGVKEFSATGFYLDTAVEITVYDNNDDTLEATFNELQRLENIFSITIPESDVCRVNGGSGWVDVSKEMLEIVNCSLEYAELTDGAFDITVAPLTRLWNVNDGGPVPSEKAIFQALELVDYTKLKLRDGQIYAEHGLELNLGGIAKGYIADKLCELLKSSGVRYGIVNLGGNVAVFGGKPDGGAYTVGIRDPFGTETELIGTVSIETGSVVTSGGYERFFIENGKLYHHIIDTNTGYPAESGLAGVTIIAESSCLADALSTAVYVLGAEAGMELIESLEGVEGLLVDDYGDEILSSGMSEYFTAS